MNGRNTTRTRDGSNNEKYMHIDISGQNMELTESLHEKVHAEFKKLEKVLDESTRVIIEIGKTTNHHKQGDIYKAEGKIVEPNNVYFAEIITEDLYTSINALADELFVQVTKSKSRNRSLLKKGQSIIKKLLRLS